MGSNTNQFVIKDGDFLLLFTYFILKLTFICSLFALFFAVYDFQFKLNSSSCTVELSKRAHEDKQHTEIKHQSHLVIRILVSTCMVMEKSITRTINYQRC